MGIGRTNVTVSDGCRQVETRADRRAGMSLPDQVYDLALPFERDGTEQVFHPSAIETPRGLLLIDVGLPGQLDALRDALDDAEWGLNDVSAVFLTHQDPDHAGGLAAVLDAIEGETGGRPPVYAHVEAAPYVDGSQELIKGQGDRYQPVPIDVAVTDGTTFRTDAGPMRVVHTPGHSPGHVSLYLPEERTLLAGDAVTVDETLAGPSPEMSLDMREATRSIGRLADLRVRTVLAYHGGLIEPGADSVEGVYHELADEYDVS